MHAEVLALLNSPFGFVAPPRGESSLGPKCILVLTKTKSEDYLLLVQTGSKFISIKIIILKSTRKKVILARNDAMSLNKLAGESRRQVDEDSLLI